MSNSTNHERRVVNCCIFCCKPASTPNLALGDDEEGEQLITRFFTLVQRFGAVDFLRSILEKNGNVQASDFKLCGDCSEIVNSFCSLYHEMKCLELQLQWRFRKVKEVIRCSDKVPSRMYSLKQSCDQAVYKTVRKFRRRLAGKFSRVLKTTSPRLILEKLAVGKVTGQDQGKGNPANPSEITKNLLSPGHGASLANLSQFFVGWISSFSAITMLLTFNTRKSYYPTATENTELRLEQSGQLSWKLDLLESELNDEGAQDFEHEDIDSHGDHMELEGAGYRSVASMEPANEGMPSIGSPDDENEPPSSINLAPEPEFIHTTEKSIAEFEDAELDDLDEKDIDSDDRCCLQPETDVKYSVTEEPAAVDASVITSSVVAVKEEHWKGRKKGNHPKTYACPECSKQFKGSRQRSLHRRMKHLLPQNLSKPFFCPYCNVRYSHPQHLNVHNASFKHQTMKRLHLSRGIGESSQMITKRRISGDGNEMMKVEACEITVPDMLPSTEQESQTVETNSEPPPVYNLRKRKSQIKEFLSDGDDEDVSGRYSPTSNDSSSSSEDSPSELDQSTPPGSKKKILRNGIRSGKYGKYHCDANGCAKMFSRAERLASHQKLHGSHPCNFCDATENYAPRLSLHEYNLHSTQSGDKDNFPPGCYKCPRCVVVSTSKQSYLQHHVMAHLGFVRTKKPGICSICSIPLEECFSERHFKTNHDTSGVDPSKIIKCRVEGCSAFFLRRAQMYRHKYSTHDAARTRQAPDDGISDTEFVLEDTAALEGRARKVKFQCKLCPKILRSVTAFRDHKKAHSYGRMIYANDGLSKLTSKFVCRLPKMYSNLRRAEQKHQSPLHGSFTCKFCDLVTEYAPDLSLHETTEHTQQTRPEEPPPKLKRFSSVHDVLISYWASTGTYPIIF